MIKRVFKGAKMTKIRLISHLRSILGTSVLIFATIVVSLQLAQGQALQVSPSTGIATSGPQGGPFSASKFTYRLAAPNGPVVYSIRNLPSWLSVSSTSGIATKA